MREFGPGFDVLHFHVEGQTAAIMRHLQASEAVLYLNRMPCEYDGSLPGCHEMLRAMLPEGARLTIHVKDPDGNVHTLPDYTGDRD
jgi:hypothetical protein